MEKERRNYVWCPQNFISKFCASGSPPGEDSALIECLNIFSIIPGIPRVDKDYELSDENIRRCAERCQKLGQSPDFKQNCPCKKGNK